MTPSQLRHIANVVDALNEARQSGLAIETGEVGVFGWNRETLEDEGLELAGVSIVFDGRTYSALTAAEALRFTEVEEEDVVEISEATEAVLDSKRLLPAGAVVQVLDAGKVTAWRRTEDGWTLA